MNIVNFNPGWPAPAHRTRRLFSKLRRKLRGLGLGRWYNQLCSGQSMSFSVLFAQMTGTAISQIEIGPSARIDRTVQITAPIGTAVCLKKAVRLGQHSRLNACQRGQIALGSSVSLGRGAEIVAQAGSVEIGSSTSIGTLCHLFSTATIKIGRHCQIGNRVRLYARSPDQSSGQASHPSSAQQSQPSAGRIVIEDHCRIGNNVLILAGVTIGQHSVIGDDTVVVSDVPAFSVAAGQPAKSFNGGLREVLQDDDPTDAGYAVRAALKSYRQRSSQQPNSSS